MFSWTETIRYPVNPRVRGGTSGTTTSGGIPYGEPARARRNLF